MTITVSTPSATDVPRVCDVLADWQRADWPGHLHPGDVGWHSMVGAEQTAAHLRVWSDDDGAPAAVGLLDGDVLRLGLDPAAADDEALAARVVDDLRATATAGLAGVGVVEARGAAAVQRRLRAEGWSDDEHWTPLSLDLGGGDPAPERPGLRIEQVGPERAPAWLEVHWSAFKGAPLDPERSAALVERWTTMADGPLARSAQHLIAHDDDRAVAVVSVWSAGRGRPGLIEPLGVHREHQGRGHGAAMASAAARALRRVGASAAVVVAEDANAGALAAYLRAGFRPQPSVADLRR